jgi:hypothetical protein
MPGRITRHRYCPPMRSGGLLIAAMLIAVPVAVGSEVHEARAAGEGGTIQPLPAQRIADTRSPGPPNAGTSIQIGPGVLAITPLASSGWGALTVRTCGTAASPSDPRILYDADTVSTLRVVRADDACAYATSSVDFLVDRSGTVSAAPSNDLSQYVPLSTPVVLRSGTIGPIAAGGSVSFNRPAALPADATAAIVSVETWAGEGYVAVGRCGLPPVPATLVLPTPMPVAVESVPIGPGQSICLTGDTRGSTMEGHIELIGYLSPNGPDPTSVPPMFTVRDEPSLEPGFAAFNPDRALDTRSGIGCVVEGDYCFEPQKLAAGETVAVAVDEYLGSWTTALSMNVTVTEPEDGGYLTVWPCDESRPEASNLNWRPGETRANLAVAKFAGDATVCFYTTAATQLIVDIAGIYDFNSGVPATAVAPKRVLDTRSAIGVPTTSVVPANGVVALKVAGKAGVPNDVAAVTMNLTVAGPEAGGYITAWPCDEPQPNASNLNYPPGGAIPNLVTVGVSAVGTVCLFTSAPAHLLADVATWYGAAGTSGLVELSPSRSLDTRSGIGVAVGKVPGNGAITLEVRGRNGVTNDANAVVMNVTVTNPESDGYLTVWPCDQARPEVSNLNFRAGDSVPNLVSVKLSAAGTVCMFSTARTDVLADVAGYLTTKKTILPTIVLV